MSAAKLTEAQAHVLAVLGEYIEAPSTRQLADKLESPRYRTQYWSYDRTHSSLSRMANGGLVRGEGRRPRRWTVTDEGRAALKAWRETNTAAAK